MFDLSANIENKIFLLIFVKAYVWDVNNIFSVIYNSYLLPNDVMNDEHFLRCLLLPVILITILSPSGCFSCDNIITSILVHNYIKVPFLINLVGSSRSEGGQWRHL